jgi:hypothetical protein
MFVSRFCTAVGKRWLATGSLCAGRGTGQRGRPSRQFGIRPCLSQMREASNQVSAGASCANRATGMVRKVDYSEWSSLTNENAG